MQKTTFLRIGIIILSGGILISLVFWFFNQIKGLSVETDLPKITGLSEKEISTPPPLRSKETKEYPQIILSQQGVIEWTNEQRKNHNMASLKPSFKLNKAAQAKVEDMFQKQYFAHDSPAGEGVGDLARKFNYEFIAVGENLALGNFRGDKDLVQAWMDSPGHRENILKSNYQEIGVAVQKGLFEGKTVWLAVQHFSIPLSACSRPNQAIKTLITQKKQELEKLQGQLQILQAELDAIRPKWSDEYQNKLVEYNDLVEKYNHLLAEVKALIDLYNEQSSQFNQCLERLK